MKSATASPRRAARAGAPRRIGVREIAAQATRESILRAATKVFARDGYAGGRVDEISKAAKSYDRMIYYYFGSKQGLYVAVLEEMQRRYSEAEAALALDAEHPVEALTAVIRFMWGYSLKNPEFITLLNNENLHRGRHLGKSMRARDVSSPALALLARVLESGWRQGLFRGELAARDIYLMIAGMSYFYLSNRYTLSAFLGERLDTAEALRHWESFVIDAVLRAVARPARDGSRWRREEAPAADVRPLYGS